jgi:hypothetical protein
VKIGPLIIGLIFAVILGTAAYHLVKKSRQSARNQGLPVLTAPAIVASKRSTAIAPPTEINPKYKVDPSTKFFARFQLEDGRTLELEVNNVQFAALNEGDHGKLAYQGTRYLGFAR